MTSLLNSHYNTDFIARQRLGLPDYTHDFMSYQFQAKGVYRAILFIHATQCSKSDITGLYYMEYILITTWYQ